MFYQTGTELVMELLPADASVCVDSVVKPHGLCAILDSSW
jgi:hypothetical protein